MRGVAPAILIGIGLIHSAVGIIGGRSTIAAMLRAGWWNSVEAAEADLLLWFLTVGVFLILLGQLGWWVERRLDHPLPAHVGWALLAFALIAGTAVGNLLFPVPLFVAAAVIIVVRAPS